MNYFIAGDKNREILYDDLIKKIKVENPNITEKYYDATQKEEGEFFQAISFTSMFGGKELIVLKRAENLKKFSTFLKAFKNFSFNNKIIIIDFDFDLDEFGKPQKKLTATQEKEIKANFKLIKFSEKDNENMIKDMVISHLKCNSNEAMELINLIGNDISKLKNELKKIELFLEGETYSLAKVKPILSLSSDYKLSEVVENLIHGRKTDAINFLKEANSTEFNRFLNKVRDELDTLYKLKLFAEEFRVLPMTIFLLGILTVELFVMRRASRLAGTQIVFQMPAKLRLV